MKELIKSLIPPIVLKLLRTLLGNKTGDLITWTGDYVSWKEAADATSGYEKGSILEMVKKSTLMVINGEASFERDGAIFHTPNHNWPLMACFLKILTSGKTSTTVLDFGGALGSTYYQLQSVLGHTADLNWIVVEQEQFVKVGTEITTTPNLGFHQSIEEVFKPRVILLSGVLQYLESPDEIIDRLINLQPEFIIVDRTCFAENSKKNILTVQKVPEWLIESSYPCWIFNELLFLSKFQEFYNVEFDFESKFDPSVNSENRRFYWKGFLLKRKK